MEKKNLAYIRLNFYYSAKDYDYKDNRVFIIAKRNLVNKTIIENWIDLVSQPYAMVLDIIKKR